MCVACEAQAYAAQGKRRIIRITAAVVLIVAVVAAVKWLL